MSPKNRAEYLAKMWPRSKTSQGTTIPKQIRDIRDAPNPIEEIDVEVIWSIKPDTGAIEVGFEAVEQEA